MRRLWAILATVLLITSSLYAQEMSKVSVVSDSLGQPGDTIDASLALQNPVEVAGVQVKLTFPSWLSSVGKPSLTERSSQMELSSAISDNKLILVIYSPSGATIPPGDGPIVEFQFKVDSDAPVGASSKIHIEEAVLSDTRANSIPVELSDGSFTVAGAKAELSLPDTTASPGSEIEIPVFLSNQMDVAGVQIELTYDPSVLTASKVEVTERSTDFTASSSISSGKIKVLLYNTEGKRISPGEGAILKISFAIPSEVASGKSSSLSLTKVVLSDPSANPIPVTKRDGRITIVQGRFSDIQLSASSYDFGFVFVRSSADWVLVIYNVGNATLTINRIASDNPAFTITSPSFPQDISAGDSVNVTVKFSPTEEKSYIGTLTIPSNDPDEPEIHVWVEGIGEEPRIPDLTLSPEDIEFHNKTTDTLEIRAKVSNIGDTVATDVWVEFFDSGVLIGSETLGKVATGSYNQAKVRWKLSGRITENHRISVKIVSSSPPEEDTSNNEASRTISVYYVDSDRPDDPFRVAEDGYSFPNWSIPPEKAKEYIRDWYKTNSLPDKLMRVLVFSDPARFLAINGVCYGMSATSILYRDNPELKPVNKETFDMTKEDPGVVEKILAYHAAQMPHHLGDLLAQKGYIGLSPLYSASKEYNKAFDYIVSQNKPVLLSIYQEENHAVVGYEIIDLGDEKRVYVYDNNSPGATRYYVQYDIAQNQVKIYDEYGIVFSHYPLTPLLETNAIRKLKEIVSDLWTHFIQSLKEKGKHLFFLGSPAYLTVTDNLGRRVGFVDGEVVNEIPGASLEEFGGAQAVYVPNDLAYHVETTGSDTGSITLDIIATGVDEEAKQMSYEDIPVLPGSKTYIDFDPASPDFTMSVDKDADGVAEETRPPDSIVRTDEILVATPPTGGALKSENTYAYPNPFRPDRELATLRFSLSKSANVTVKLYDASGRLVTTLAQDEPMEAGVEQSIAWDGKNDRGDIVANGVYFYRITTSAGEEAIGKVAVLR